MKQIWVIPFGAFVGLAQAQSIDWNRVRSSCFSEISGYDAFHGTGDTSHQAMHIEPDRGCGANGLGKQRQHKPQQPIGALPKRLNASEPKFSALGLRPPQMGDARHVLKSDVAVAVQA